MDKDVIYLIISFVIIVAAILAFANFSQLQNISFDNIFNITDYKK